MFFYSTKVKHVLSWEFSEISSFGNCCSDVSIALFLQRQSSKDVLQLEVCHFIKKETLAQVFVYEFCEIFKNIYFVEHLQTTPPASFPFSSNIVFSQLRSHKNNSFIRTLL